MSATTALKKATDNRAKAEATLDTWIAKRDAGAAALVSARLEADTLRERHQRFILGRGDALPAGVLVAADATVKQCAEDVATLETAVSSAEAALVVAEEQTDEALRAAWFEVEATAKAETVNALVKFGWLAWRARQCAGENTIGHRQYMEHLADAARTRMYPTNPALLDTVPEPDNMPLPTRIHRSPKVSAERRDAINRHMQQPKAA